MSAATVQPRSPLLHQLEEGRGGRRRELDCVVGVVGIYAWRKDRTAESVGVGVVRHPAEPDVILHKLIWNRITPSDRHLGDAAGVVAVQADALDKNYLRRWAEELKVGGELERLLSGEIKPKQT